MRPQSEIDIEYTQECAQAMHKLFIIQDLETQVEAHKEKADKLRHEKAAPPAAEPVVLPPEETI